MVPELKNPRFEEIILQFRKELEGQKKKLYEEVDYNNKLNPPEQQYRKKVLELENSFKNLLSSIERANLGFGKFLEYKNAALSKEELDKCDQDLTRIAQKKQTEDDFNKAQDLQEYFGFSEDVLSYIYKTGYYLFEEEQYAEAADLFYFLAMLDSCFADYWVALGITEKKLGKTEDALASFVMASIIEPNNPDTHLACADCYKEMNDMASAEVELEQARLLLEANVKAEV